MAVKGGLGGLALPCRGMGVSPSSLFHIYSLFKTNWYRPLERDDIEWHASNEVLGNAGWGKNEYDCQQRSHRHARVPGECSSKGGQCIARAPAMLSGI